MHADTAAPKLLAEQLLSFGQAAAMFPPYRRGRPVSPSCVWRWFRSGVRLANGEVVRLEAIKVAGRHLTSIEAVQRFIAAQQMNDSITSGQPSVSAAGMRTSSRRNRDSERALDRLRAIQHNQSGTGHDRQTAASAPDELPVSPRARPAADGRATAND